MGTGLRSAIWTQSHITELLSSGGKEKDRFQFSEDVLEAVQREGMMVCGQ